jgi:hypothetical protein
MRILARWEEAPDYPFGSRRALATLEEERREVLESVIETMGTKPRDADCLAACSSLLHHLAGSTGAPAPFGLSTIGQIAVTVTETDRAIRFYRDTLGYLNPRI